MEAPGILFQQGRLQWESSEGFTACNSNDGKRSEWVKFLGSGDLVQLVPRQPEQAIQSLTTTVYGVSSKGRPLGSEPAVVCEWQVR